MNNNTIVLPYPGMVFFPLDILTAQEMNQIVANYTYLGNKVSELLGDIDDILHDINSGSGGTGMEIEES